MKYVRFNWRSWPTLSYCLGFLDHIAFIACISANVQFVERGPVLLVNAFI